MFALPAPYGRLLLPIYLPSLLVSISQTALLILLPLHAVELGLGAAVAALIVGARGIGVLLFDIPSGVLASRYGDRAVLFIGLGLIFAGTLCVAYAASPWLLALGALLNGAGFSAWMLGRQSYIAETCASHETGQAIAALGGLQRVGMALGPGLGAWLAQATSYSLSFIGGAVLTVLATVFVLAQRWPDAVRRAAPSLSLRPTLALARRHRRIFLTAGWAALALQLMRATRTVLVPLIGVAIGLDAVTIGFVYSVSAVIDMSLFYPVGLLVDRRGRKWSAVPSLVLFALGLALLPLAAGEWSLLAIASLLGLANGLGTGIVMIIGADLARLSDDRSQFLGIWRLIGDLGVSGGPLLCAALLGVAGLGAASLAAAGLGLAGAVTMWRAVPETLVRARPRTAELP